MNDKTYADVDKALATFGGAPIKYRSFGSPVLRAAARMPLAPPAALPDEPVYESAAAPIAPPAVPAAAAPHPQARPEQRPAARPPAAVPPPTAGEPGAGEPEPASKLFPLLGAAMPEAADVMVTTESAPRRRDLTGPAGGAIAAPPVYHAPPPPPPALAPPAAVTARMPEPDPVPAAPPPEPRMPPAAPPRQPVAPPPAAAWPRAARPEPPEQQTARTAPATVASEPYPPFTSLAAHLARTGAAAAAGERPGPSGIISAPRAAAVAEPRGDRRSVAEMFRLLSAGRGERVGESSGFARARDGESALFRRL